MTIPMVVDIGRSALFMAMMLAGPLLIAGLVVGLAVGVFQAVTQISEMTLTFIPKILAVGTVLLFLMPWMITKFVDFINHLFALIPMVA